MKQNNYGELIFNESDIVNLLMQGHDLDSLKNILVDDTVDTKQLANLFKSFPNIFVPYASIENSKTITEWDQERQQNWYMPQDYKDMDISEYVLSLCKNEAELQRCGEELLLYQQHDLFNLLKYLKYLVDLMQKNQIIWGVGRGSSTASFILYKLGVHRVDSLFYDLSITEFLR
jgi:hypothetical protein